MIGIGEAIRIIRKEKGISQKSLALLCGLSANSITSIEKGRHIPSQRNLSLICAAMNVPLAYLALSTITEEDFKDEHKILFNTLLVPLRKFLME